MNEAEVVEIMREGILTLIKVAGPPLLVAMVIGLAISLVQALTQIQEMTLTFVPKILAGFLALVIFLPFMLQTMITFTHSMMDRMIAVP